MFQLIVDQNLETNDYSTVSLITVNVIGSY